MTTNRSMHIAVGASVFAIISASAIYYLTGGKTDGFVSTPMAVAAKLSNAMSEMGSVKASMATYYSSEGRYPKNNLDAGVKEPQDFQSKAVESITVVGSKVTAIVAGNSEPRQTISLLIDPKSLEGNTIRWKCQTTNISKDILVYLKGCKDAGSERLKRFMLMVERGDIEGIKSLIDDTDNETLSQALLQTLKLDKQEDYKGVEIVDLLVINGANVNASDVEGSALHQATSIQHPIAMAKLLLDKGALVSAIDSDGNTVLMRALKAGRDSQFIRYFVQQDINLDQQNKIKKTALHLAAEVGNTSGVQILLELGADAGLLDISEQPALSNALAHNQARVVELLSQATPNAAQWMADFAQAPQMPAKPKAGFHKTELLKAIETNQISLVRKQLEMGADYTDTALIEAARNRQAYVVDWMLNNGGDVSAVDAKGDTPLSATLSASIPIDSRASKIVSQLLEHGASATTLDRLGQSTLHYLAKAEQYSPEDAQEISRYLLEKGVSPDEADMDGDTPLAVAVKLSRVSLVSEFLSQGASAEGHDRTQTLFLDIAAKQGDAEVTNLLLSNGADLARSNLQDIVHRLLYFAVEVNDLDRIDRLLSDGAFPSKDLYFSGKLNVVESAISLAIRNNNWALVDHFAKAGAPLPSQVWLQTASVEKQSKDSTKQAIPLLEYALQNGGDIQALLDVGADPDIQNTKGESTLIWALEKRIDLAPTILLQSGANPSQVNPAGQSALSLAVLQNKEDLALLLIEKGARPLNLVELKMLELQAEKTKMQRLAVVIQPFLDEVDLSKQVKRRFEKDQGQTLTYWSESCDIPESRGFYLSKIGDVFKLLVDSLGGESTLSGYPNVVNLYQDERFEWIAADEFLLEGTGNSNSWVGMLAFRQCTAEAEPANMVGTWSNRQGGFNKFRINIQPGVSNTIRTGKSNRPRNFTTSRTYQGNKLIFVGQQSEQAWLIQAGEYVAYFYRDQKPPMTLYRLMDGREVDSSFSITNIAPKPAY